MAQRLAALFGVACLACAAPVASETVVAARMVRAQSVLMASDLALLEDTTPGAVTQMAAAIGKEARINLYQGRPIRPSDLGPPAVIERNQLITIRYFYAGLAIVTDGRALGRAGVGETIRVMNLNSRATVTGEVLADGSVSVAPAVQ